MTDKLVGTAVRGSTIGEVMANINRAEELGVHAAWMTTGGASLDSMTCFAAAAASTSSIKLGTSIVPTYPRHPLVAVQQAQVVAQLAPGRFRLGVGPSHRPTIESMGIEFDAPLAHLREYIQILKSVLQTGAVDFDGEHYSAHATIPGPLDVQVMASALRKGSFELCGAEADGAISWICPSSYLRDVALPAMEKGAREASRPVPPLIAHAPVCVHENPDEVRAALRQQFGHPGLPFYQNMLIEAGYPEAKEGVWSDAMIDGVAIWGDEETVAQGIQELLDMGATEVLASPVTAGPDPAASLERTTKLLGQAAASVR
ncbi:MAG: LLM class flavin-dependent oxidoreductase [SAR202 cluster bacterium]|nr:LLM class flavin-dependent oxidoreductase [Chloroflexota bacterium]MQF94868.1 LLM class flavin-dependent oxidoreductase [SAR202 cluster bacterium]MQG35050.1 LLM class flavin-dependent oxidoreductase [SAR202 cluster bacterium]HCL25264.1 LLM class flavin-dependent oxidoreductase [Dehalococcoidia bacterium]|tara:strand:+ start:216 stop:1163 length:948 start_codon:yes stop_codon:yes gene_type:complete